jgi:transcription elongation factor Elf1
MLLVDCPICGHPAAVDAAVATLDCPACGVSFEIVPDEPAMAAAA